MNFLTIFSAAIKPGDISTALNGFASGTTGIINAIIGAIAGLLAIAFAIYIIYWIVKRNGNNSVLEEANKHIKTGLITIVAVVLVGSLFTLINTLFIKVADDPFEITGSLLALKAWL